VERKQEPQEVIQNRGVYAGRKKYGAKDDLRKVQGIESCQHVDRGFFRDGDQCPEREKICAGNIGTLVEWAGLAVCL
jgi:hypothetical protein